jgi:hypothetical protein
MRGGRRLLVPVRSCARRFGGTCPLQRGGRETRRGEEAASSPRFTWTLPRSRALTWAARDRSVCPGPSRVGVQGRCQPVPAQGQPLQARAGGPRRPLPDKHRSIPAACAFPCSRGRPQCRLRPCPAAPRPSLDHTPATAGVHGADRQSRPPRSHCVAFNTSRRRAGWWTGTARVSRAVAPRKWRS